MALPPVPSEREAYEIAEAAVNVLWDRWPDLAAITGAHASGYPLVTWLDGPSQRTARRLIDAALPADARSGLILRRRLSPESLAEYLASDPGGQPCLLDVERALVYEDLRTTPSQFATVLLAAVPNRPTLDDDYLVVSSQRVEYGFGHLRKHVTADLVGAVHAAMEHP